VFSKTLNKVEILEDYVIMWTLYYVLIPVLAMAVIWGQMHVFKQEETVRMKMLKFQFVFNLKIIMSCLTALVIKFSQKIPALSAPPRGDGPQTRLLRLLRLLYFVLFVVVCVMAQISWLTTLVPMSPDPATFVYLCWCAFGIYGQYLVMALFLTLLWSLSKLLEKVTQYSPSQIPGNFDFRNARALVSFVYAALISALCIHGGLQLPQVKEVHVHLGERLPSSLSGFVIAQLSDIHLGPTSGFSRLKEIVAITNSIDADITVVNGDLMDGVVRDLGEAVLQLGKLQSKQGVYFTTGNHEYLSGDVDGLFQFLRQHGVQPLHNSNVKIRGKGDDDFFYLVGVDDIFAESVHYKGHGFHLSAAVNGTDAEHVRILLAHQPKAARKALMSDHFFDLILSGHTHGGQYFPYNFLIWIGNPYFRGLYKDVGSEGKSQVYVTEGSVFWGSPFRLASTMEISKIVLTN